MRIVCWQTILLKYHTLFFSKIRKDVAKVSSAAVVIGALRINTELDEILSQKWLYWTKKRRIYLPVSAYGTRNILKKIYDEVKENMFDMNNTRNVILARGCCRI